MQLEQSLILSQAFLSAYMTGIIWLIQRVHYPIFSIFTPESFKEAEEFHVSRISSIVAPFMIMELIGALLLCYFFEMSAISGFILATTGVTWLWTFLVSVPCHNQLITGKNQIALERLIFSNWVRTLVWSLKSIGIFGWLILNS